MKTPFERWIAGSADEIRSLRKADGDGDSTGVVMRVFFLGALAAAMTCGSAAHAADAAAGKEKAEMCAGCHGENGISQTENIPSLAGQPDQFLQWQLVFFRGGARKNEQMQPIAEQVGNEDVRALGAYFASLTPPKTTAPDD